MTRISQSERNVKSILPPKIKSFSASKIRAKVGEEITVYWNTYDADLVKIVPFGLEKPNGERTIRIKEFDSQGKFQIYFMQPIRFFTKLLFRELRLQN
jgi:hypothetical protein